MPSGSLLVSRGRGQGGSPRDRACRKNVLTGQFSCGHPPHPRPIFGWSRRGTHLRTNPLSLMRRTIILCALLIFLSAPAASAQSSVSLRGNVGAAFFQSPEGLKSVLNSGVNLGLGAGIEVYRGLEVVVQGSYDRFTFNGDNYALLEGNVPTGIDVHGGALNVFNGTVGLRYTLRNPSDAHPYVSGGVGLYRTVLEQTEIPNTGQVLPREENTGRGFHIALGSTFRITNTYSFFFEPRYVVVDTEDSDLQTRTSTRYVTVRLGLDVQL